MTTSYPASAVLMELAAYMEKMLLKVQVEWSPRTETTRLMLWRTEFPTASTWHFEFLLIHISSVELLSPALETGSAADLEHRSAKMNGLLPNRGKRQRKRKLDDRLKHRPTVMRPCCCIPILDSGRFPRSLFLPSVVRSAGLVCLVVKTGGPREMDSQGRSVRLKASLHELVEPYRPTDVGHWPNLTGNCLSGPKFQERSNTQSGWATDTHSGRVTCYGIGLCESSPEIQQSQLS